MCSLCTFSRLGSTINLKISSVATNAAKVLEILRKHTRIALWIHENRKRFFDPTQTFLANLRAEVADELLKSPGGPRGAARVSHGRLGKFWCL